MLRIANVCLSDTDSVAGESALRLAEELADRGHDVYSVVTEGSRLSQALRDRKLRQVTVPRRSTRLDLRAHLKVRSFLKRHPLDVVQAHGYQDLGVIYPGLIGSAVPRMFLILDDLRGGMPGRGMLGRLLGKKLSGVIVPTETGRRAAASAAPLFRDRIAVIPRGFDPALYDLGPDARASARAALGFEAGDVVVGAVGRIGRERGQYELLEAARTVRRRHSALRLVIAGEALSAEGEKLVAFIRDRIHEYHMVEDVRVIAHPDSTPELLGALDIFVMPSVEESFSGPLAEAMLSGLACVGTESGGTPEMLDYGKAGLISPPGSADGLARALMTLLETPELRDILGRRARESARARFSIDRVMELVEDLYSGS